MTDIDDMPGKKPFAEDHLAPAEAPRSDEDYDSEMAATSPGGSLGRLVTDGYRLTAGLARAG